MMRLLAIALAGCGARTVTPVVDNHGGGAGGSPSLELTVEAADGGHAAIVHNGGDAPVQLQRELIVRDAHGNAIEAAGLYLRESCQGDPPDCIELAAGATLRTVPWTDMIGDAQCECTKCGPAPAGQYTFTITRCDDGAPVTSAPFAVSER